MGGHCSRVDLCLRVSSDVPAVQIDQEDGIVHESVCDGNLDSWNHCRLLLALSVLLPGTAILLDHANELDIAGHDCGDGSDETGAQEEEGETSDVEEGSGVAKAGGQEGGLYIGRGEHVEDIETPGKKVEGDREMDDCWVNWGSESVSV